MKSPATLTLAALFLAACAQHDPWADRGGSAAGHFSRAKDYEFYQPSLVQIARMRGSGTYVDDPNRPVTVTDADVITFTEHVQGILEARFTNSRIARYVSSSLQVGLLAATGIAGVTGAGATTIAALTLTGTIPPQLSDIFHAKERAGAYQQAAANIATAKANFLVAQAGNKKIGQIPSATTLTPDGAKLYAEVATQLEGADAALQGQLPAVMAALPTPAPKPSAPPPS